MPGKKKKGEESKVGSKVSSLELEHDMLTQYGELMFPEFKKEHFHQFVTIMPDNECLREIVIDFFVNFAVVATDTHFVKSFVDLVGSLIDIKSGLTPVTVINAAGKVIDTMDKVIEQSNAKGHQEFHFPIHLCCHEKYQPFNVKLDVDYRILLNDVESKRDFVKYDFHLSAGPAPPVKKERSVTGEELHSRSAVSGTEHLECGFVTDTDFIVSVWFNEECDSHWSINPTPWVSMIRFDHLKIVITTTAECKQGKAPEFKLNPPPEEPKTPKDEGTKKAPDTGSKG